MTYKNMLENITQLSQHGNTSQSKLSVLRLTETYQRTSISSRYTGTRPNHYYQSYDLQKHTREHQSALVTWEHVPNNIISLMTYRNIPENINQLS